MERQRSERKKRLKRTVVTNAGLMLFSAVVSVTSGNTAFMAEAVHDAADTVTHGGRYYAEKNSVNQSGRNFQRFSKASFFILSGLSAFTATRLGVDFLNGAEESGQQWLQLAASGVIAGGNVYAYKQMDAVEEHSIASSHSHHHARIDMVASIGLSACIAVDALGLDGASELGGALFAGYTAYELFPTEKRLHSH